MSVYRGGKPKDKNPAKSPKPQPRPTPQPQVRQPDSELIGLNDHRQRYGHDPLDDPEAIDDGPEVDDQIVDGSPPPPPSGGFYDQGGGFYDENPGGSRRGSGSGATKLAKSAAGKKIALAASGFFAPIIIVVALLVLAAEAGLQTDQIARAIIGVRFSRLYAQMTKRLGHVKETHLLWSLNEDGDISDINKRRPARTGRLISRLMGVSDKKIHRSLESKYKLSYERDPTRPGQKKLVGIVDRVTKETVFDANNPNRGTVGQLNDLEKTFKRGDDTLRGRFLARRSIRYLGYQAGFRFTRFRSAMDKIRQKIRGPPRVAEAAKEIRNDVINDKSNVRKTRFPGFRLKIAGLFDIDNEKFDEAGKGWAAKSKDWVKRGANKLSLDTGKLANKFAPGFLSRIARFTRNASIILLTATAFCTAREVVNMIRELAQLKIFQQMDTTANVLTTASQIKAGDIEHEIVNHQNHQFDGFANSTTYQALHNGITNQDKSKVAATIKYINRHFNIRNSFGAVFKILNVFTTKFIGWVSEAVAAIPQVRMQNFFAGLLNRTPGVGSLLGLFGVDRVPDSRALVGYIIGGVCKTILSPAGAITIAVALGLLEIAITVLTGGGWAGVRVALHVLMQTVILAFAIGRVVSATSLDDVAVNVLMPAGVAIASGPDSALSDEPGAGPENYLKVDMGAVPLAGGLGLAEGGYPIDRDTAVAQDRYYIAQYRQGYAREGIWSNIASPRNPYSLIAKLQSWLPSNPLQSQPDQVRSTAGWLASSSTGWLASTKADELTNEDLAELLYPSYERSVLLEDEEDLESAEISNDTGDFRVNADVVNPEDYYQIIDQPASQVSVIGFDDQIMDGDGGNGKFSFGENSVYVEDNMVRLKADYNQCLGFDISEWQLYQADITDENDEPYYYNTCATNEDARRYMLYYHDCLHVNDLVLEGTNNSPMFATDCDDLLPDENLEKLQEGDPVDPGEPIRYRQGSQTLPNLLGLSVFDQPTVGLTESGGAKNTWQSMVQILSTPWEDRRWHLA